MAEIIQFTKPQDNNECDRFQKFPYLARVLREDISFGIDQNFVASTPKEKAELEAFRADPLWPKFLAEASDLIRPILQFAELHSDIPDEWCALLLRDADEGIPALSLSIGASASVVVVRAQHRKPENYLGTSEQALQTITAPRVHIGSDISPGETEQETLETLDPVLLRDIHTLFLRQAISIQRGYEIEHTSKDPMLCLRCDIPDEDDPEYSYRYVLMLNPNIYDLSYAKPKKRRWFNRK